ncbi:fumarylacetoacetate hydrolase family protein [Nocardia arthritidis]|uniref:fumarylacetoacetate hydrolase family protein n=1 Tax=Nocardia arthritidis TaxID=228602 RepID=UPI0007A51772|nr:fumarylacetoacetate hydrolase family protein [Nocardia arthritidis]
MRFVVFAGNCLGLVQGDDVVDVTALVPGPIGPAGPLHQLIESGAATGWRPEQLEGLPRQAFVEITVAAPFPRPPKIIGAPVNYLDHKAEMSETHSIADLGVFLKASSSVIGPGEQVRLPYGDKRIDQEGELALVIGRTAKDVPAERALEHVFGYTCGLDMTVRSSEDRSTRKSFDTFTPLGPVVVTGDELGDPGSLQLETRVNGTVRQRTSTADLIFGVAELVAYSSSVMTLWPGDVILTGTPAGVGQVHDGDSVEVEISGIGTLAVGVTGASARPYGQRPGLAVRSASTSG